MEKLLERIRKGEDIEKILKEERWQEFEKIVAWIFEIHGYKTKIHFRLKKSKKEIDVLAEKGNIVIAVECKKWKGKSQSRAKMEKVAREHKEKIEELKSEMEKKPEILPVVVTLLEVETKQVKNVIFVPVYKLNSFLREEIYFLL